MGNPFSEFIDHLKGLADQSGEGLRWLWKPMLFVSVGAHLLLFLIPVPADPKNANDNQNDKPVQVKSFKVEAKPTPKAQTPTPKATPKPRVRPSPKPRTVTRRPPPRPRRRVQQPRPPAVVVKPSPRPSPTQPPTPESSPNPSPVLTPTPSPSPTVAVNPDVQENPEGTQLSPQDKQFLDPLIEGITIENSGGVESLVKPIIPFPGDLPDASAFFSDQTDENGNPLARDGIVEGGFFTVETRSADWQLAEYVQLFEDIYAQAGANVGVPFAYGGGQCLPTTGPDSTVRYVCLVKAQGGIGQPKVAVTIWKKKPGT